MAERQRESGRKLAGSFLARRAARASLPRDIFVAVDEHFSFVRGPGVSFNRDVSDRAACRVETSFGFCFTRSLEMEFLIKS